MNGLVYNGADCAAGNRGLLLCQLETQPNSLFDPGSSSIGTHRIFTGTLYDDIIINNKKGLSQNVNFVTALKIKYPKNGFTKARV
jgi:hypothetical protein